MVFDVKPSSCAGPFGTLEIVDQNFSVEAFPLLPLETHTAYHKYISFVNLHGVEAGRYFGSLPCTAHLCPLLPLLVILMEEGKSLKASLMVATEEVDLLIGSEESGIVSDGWKERVEATIGQWDESKAALH